MPSFDEASINPIDHVVHVAAAAELDFQRQLT
jgi:hypothetical protein